MPISLNFCSFKSFESSQSPCSYITSKKYPKLLGFLFCVLCMGATHIYIRVYMGIAYSSHSLMLITQSLGISKFRQSQAEEKITPCSKSGNPSSIQAWNSTSNVSKSFIQRKGCLCPPYIISHYWSSLISFQLLSPWLVICEQEIPCSSQAEHSRGGDAEWHIKV